MDDELLFRNDTVKPHSFISIFNMKIESSKLRLNDLTMFGPLSGNTENHDSLVLYNSFFMINLDKLIEIIYTIFLRVIHV